MRLHWCVVTVGARLSVPLFTASKERGRMEYNSEIVICVISHMSACKKKMNAHLVIDVCAYTHAPTHAKNINGLELNLKSRCGMQIIVLKTLNVVFWPKGLYSEYNMFTFTAELFGSGLKSWNKNTQKQVTF